MYGMKCGISERRGRSVTTAYTRVQFVRGTLHVLVHIGNNSLFIAILLKQSSVKLSLICHPISTVGLVHTNVEEQANTRAFTLETYKNIL